MAKRPAKTILPGDTEETQVRMGFGEHLDDLRKRLMYSIAGSIGFVVVCLYYSRNIVFYLVRPYLLALKAHGYPAIFSFDKPQAVVINYLSIGVKAGLVLASPWIIYQLWLFVAAGLYQKERRIIYRYITPSALLFLVGVAFFYFLVLPLTLNFFIGFTDHTAIKAPQATWLEQKLGLDTSSKGVTATQPSTHPTLLQIPVVTTDPPKPPDGFGYLFFNLTDGVMKFRVGDQTSVLMVSQDGSLFSNVPQFDEYISFLTFMSLLFGGAFEMPMVILILAQVGLVTVATFRKIRKYAYFGIAIAACVAAPSGDPLTMLCLMVPLIVLYEAGVIAASFAVRKREAKTAAEADADA
jgi:sec-independent protein translocase protein TatC